MLLNKGLACAANEGGNRCLTLCQFEIGLSQRILIASRLIYMGSLWQYVVLNMYDAITALIAVSLKTCSHCRSESMGYRIILDVWKSQKEHYEASLLQV